MNCFGTKSGMDYAIDTNSTTQTGKPYGWMYCPITWYRWTNLSHSGSKWQVSRRWRLFHVDTIEGVAPEGGELEIDHFLAHRLELNGVCNREPGSLLLEGDLCPLVKFCALCGVRHGLGLDHHVFKRRQCRLRLWATCSRPRVTALEELPLRLSRE